MDASEESEIRELIAELDSLRSGERVVALLVAYGAGAVEPLRDYLLEGRPSAVFQPRLGAVKVLAALGAREVLLEYLLNPKPILDPVVRLAEESVESEAARSLAFWRTEETFQLLLDLSHTRMLIGLIDALAEFGRAEAIPFFDRALEDDFYRPAAEEAFRKLGAAARPALVLSLLTPLPGRAAETPSSLRRRRSAAGLLAETGIGVADWNALQPLLDEEQPEIVVAAAKMAVSAGTREDWGMAASRLLDVLPSSAWYLHEDIEEILVALGEKMLVNEEVERRLRLPERARVQDRALPVLLRVRRRLFSP